jgi:hypothetical protein
MAHRRVTDQFGHEWDVWEVIPSAIERRFRNSKPVLIDRRRQPEIRIKAAVSDELQNGWLAFQAPHEKRRYAPVPSNWMTLPDDELLRLLDQADVVGKPKRLIE